MSESKRTSGPQFRADQPQEQETVRTTIVGGRPPGSGQRLGPIPRGVEVLVKKAAVDAEFKRRLLAERADAAKAIGLTLDPAEAMMLTAVPAAQLETIIARTTVPQEHRRAFLGTAAAAMLAAVGLVSSGCGSSDPPVAGIIPDDPTVDEYGRPIRNKMGETGGAAPEEPDMPFEAGPPSTPDGSADDGDAAPDESPDAGSDQEPAQLGGGEPNGDSPDLNSAPSGVRPDEVPAPTGIRPDLPDPPTGAEPPNASPQRDTNHARRTSPCRPTSRWST